MGNVIDYIKEYGNLDFSAKPFNSVDGLILSQFSYLKMDGIVPEVGQNREDMELRDIVSHNDYLNLYADERYAANNREFFEAMASSRRFGLIKLNHYINLISKKSEMQFSAVMCFLPEGKPCLVYRGTDENLISWKEDFNMSFLRTIPAQIKSLDYMNYVAERIRGNFYVAGHSKGGNLSVYAALMCPMETYERIDRVYSFDGPGFYKDVFNEDDFDRINEKLYKLVPRSSVVGMLLQSQENYKVIESKNIGILQHDPFNWVVEGDDFVYRDDVKDLYTLQNDSINDWAMHSKPEQLQAFCNQLFDVAQKCGIDDLNDFKGNYGDILKKLTHVIETMDSENKDLIKQVVKNLVDSFIGTVKLKPGKSK